MFGRPSPAAGRYSRDIDLERTLLEREPLLEMLHAHRSAAQDGHGRLVLVAGEAGIGKTSLVERYCRDLPSDIRVIMGACDALSTPRPLGPLYDMRRSLAPAFGEVLATDDRDRIFDALLEHLRSQRHTVIVIQDVHWADDATLDLLRFLGRRIASTPTFGIVTYRSDEVRARHPLRAVLGDLATSTAVHRLVVPALSRDAVEGLARHFDVDVDVDELHRTTGGNAFFVTEVLATGGTDVPATVQDAVSARASRLPDAARRLLDLASVVGPEFDASTLLGLGAAADDLEAILDAGILRADGSRVSFRHELVRDAVDRALSGPQRVALHTRVLAYLESHTANIDDPAVLAHHAAEAGDANAVLRYAPEAAARAAALRAHREARAQYARALPYLEWLPDERRAELLDAYATECTIGDAFAEGERVRRQAVEIWRRLERPRRVGHGLSKLAQAQHGLGRDVDAEASNDEAIRVLEPLESGFELARALWYAAILRRARGDAQGAVGVGKRAIALSRRLGERAMLANALNAVGAALLDVGDDEGYDRLAQSRALGRELDIPELVADAHAAAGGAATERHRFGDAVRELQAAIAIAIDRDHDNIRFAALASLALALVHLGRWSEASDAARAVVDRPRSASYSRITALLALGRLRARRGDPDAGEPLDAALDEALRSDSGHRAIPIRLARIEAAMLSGDADRARAEARAARDEPPGPDRPWRAGELAYWLARLGEPHDLPEALAEPYALQLEGRAEAAAEAWDALGCPYEAARARLESSDPAVVRTALDAFTELGARPSASAAARRLRELGVRGVPRGPRQATREHPAHLTRRESQVLALLADGLRNREIAERHGVSPRTVDHQVSAVLAKLDVRSRTEAVAEAHRLGLLPQHRQADEQA